ncbi:hypothetical protein IT398_02825 [Candidatus Nomurabacteria bacterium]|nr:hypothetical protein [Candidatus Nomurabacteria bacterium]
MMIIYHQNRNYRGWGLVFLVSIVLFAGGFFSRNLSGLALWIGSPFWFIRDSVTALWQNDLVAENNFLKKRVNLLETESQERTLLIKDNDWLRSELGRKLNGQSEREIARVLVGWNSGPFDVLTIDLGQNNATRPPVVGDPVLAGGNVWLGEVADVYGSKSKVKLLSISGQITPVVLGDGRIPVTLSGQGGGNFSLTLPAGSTVKVGDLALASGPDRDWVVAVVGAVTSMPATGEQKVFLRQPLKASSLKYVELATH